MFLFLFMYLLEFVYFKFFDVFCLTPGHPWKTVLSLTGYPQAKEDVINK